MGFKERYLIEEGITDFRNGNLALQLQGMTPEQKQALQTMGGRFKMAAKSGLKDGALGLAGGALGGGLVAGIPGAAVGAAIAGPAVALGSTGGQYLNMKSMGNMTPQEIENFAKMAEEKFGKEYADNLRKHGKTL